MDEDQNHPKKDTETSTITSDQINKIQTNIVTAGFITALLVMLTVPVIFVIADENNDWPNVLTLVVEVAVGIIIAATVYFYSKSQNDVIQESNRRMACVLEELELGRVEERKFATRILISRMTNTIRFLESILRTDTRYEKSTTDKDKEECLTIQWNVAKRISSMSDVEIDPSTLARIFDEKLVFMYNDVRIQLQWVPRKFLTVEDYAYERTDYRKVCEDCINSCTMLREYVESHMKSSPM